MLLDLRILPFTRAVASVTESSSLAGTLLSWPVRTRLAIVLTRTSHAQGRAAVVACHCAGVALGDLPAATDGWLRHRRVWTTHERRCAVLHARSDISRPRLGPSGVCPTGICSIRASLSASGAGRAGARLPRCDGQRAGIGAAARRGNHPHAGRTGRPLLASLATGSGAIFRRGTPDGGHSHAG